MLDWTIRQAKVVDGTGSPWFRADVGVEGDRVVTVGRIPEGRAEREIDGAGYVLAPGFIDIHTHSDLPLVVDPRAEGKIRQGVTTEVIGHCGFAVAPLVGGMVDQMRRRLATYNPPAELDWATMDEYLGRLERQGVGVNCVALAGHGTLRTGVMGVKDSPPTADEGEAMARLLQEAMDAGAIGISTGLIYPPSSYAGTDELVALAKIASARGGLYFSHVRGDGPGATEGIREAIEIARRAASGKPAQAGNDAGDMGGGGDRRWECACLLNEREGARAPVWKSTPKTYLAPSIFLSPSRATLSQKNGQWRPL